MDATTIQPVRAGMPGAAASPDASLPAHSPSASTPVEHARGETEMAFEAMVLRPMVEAMLPKGGAFGAATGSGAWRGMMVDALADTLARDGTLGLDRALGRDAFGTHDTLSTQAAGDGATDPARQAAPGERPVGPWR